VGILNDVLAPRFGEEAVRYSIFSLNFLYLVPALLIFLAARHLVKDIASLGRESSE